MIEVDARGLSCPEPVMLALKAIKQNQGQTVRVLVSTATSRDNVKSMALKRHKTVDVQDADGDFALTIQ